ncbi:hypothetical protein B4U79_02567 [Dinothrombium tinctorium]|uniref:BPTI/Kunitz inhibitor domain-containing protein n=1 Tax=Dinothrombium tinctorium TaxID=1965070 RepID=A0A3S3RUZ6_9ACAR|nr:hypothetical protein B4U79_11512 [Dinothrombium tinctorium]RWS09240.1 hypothetical protein B4U79_02567 [Dinothrombium tinctorium]
MRYDCPQIQSAQSSIQQNSEACVHHKKSYALGEKIQTSNPCAICSCSYDNEIRCAYSECPGDAFGVPPYPQNATEQEISGKYKNCYYAYTLNECCGKPRCPSDQELTQEKKCVYGGRTYKLGERIYPSEDACKTCVCDEKFDSGSFLSSSSCRKIECDLNMKLLSKGCVPVYHEAHCCPIEYKCPPPNFEEKQAICALKPEVGPCEALIQRYYHNATTKACERFTYGGCAGNENNFKTLAECRQFCSRVKPTNAPRDKNKCYFGEKSYAVGQKLTFDKC